MDLSSSRTAGFAANPISFAEILAYQELMKIDINAEELRAIKYLDMIYLSNSVKEQKV